MAKREAAGLSRGEIFCRRGPRLPDIIEETIPAKRGRIDLDATVLDAIDEAPIVNIAREIIKQGLKQGARRIYIIPQKRKIRCAVLVAVDPQNLRTLPKYVHAVLVSRFKIMAGAKIEIRNQPQKGQFGCQLQGFDGSICLKARFRPTPFGEKVTLIITKS